MARAINFVEEARQQHRLWTPRLIDDGTLLGWYSARDFSTIAATAGLVDQWSDKSRFARHVTSTGASRPTFNPSGALGQPAVINSAASMGMQHGSPYMFTAANSTGLTIVSLLHNVTVTGPVAGEASTAVSGPLFAPLLSRSGFQSAYQQRNDASTSPSTSTTALMAAAAFGANIFTLASNVIPPASGSAVTGYYNGTTGSAPQTRTYSGATTLNSFSLFNYYRPGPVYANGMSGALCEVVIFAGTDQRTRQIVEGYLASRWLNLQSLAGIPRLDASHPYVNRPPEIGV